jgi:hypothetical protein
MKAPSVTDALNDMAKDAAKAEHYRHALEIIVEEAKAFPDRDGIAAGAIARNALKRA